MKVFIAQVFRTDNPGFLLKADGTGSLHKELVIAIHRYQTEDKV